MTPRSIFALLAFPLLICCGQPPRFESRAGAPRYADPKNIAVDTLASKWKLVASRRLPYNAGPLPTVGVEVVAVFVIDTVGRIELPTIAFINSAHPPFRQSLCGFLRQSKFIRTSPGTERHPELRLQPFVFNAHGGGDTALANAIARTTARELQTMPRDQLFAYLESLPTCS